eukprot:5588211-Prymnesium_polylepis.1
MSRTECARQGAEAIGAKTQRREGYPVFRTIKSAPFSGSKRAIHPRGLRAARTLVCTRISRTTVPRTVASPRGITKLLPLRVRPIQSPPYMQAHIRLIAMLSLRHPTYTVHARERAIRLSHTTPCPCPMVAANAAQSRAATRKQFNNQPCRNTRPSASPQPARLTSECCPSGRSSRPPTHAAAALACEAPP